MTTERSALVGYDMFMRYTDKAGNRHIASHRVYDGEAFLKARLADAAKEGGQSTCAPITEAEYLAERATGRK